MKISQRVFANFVIILSLAIGVFAQSQSTTGLIQGTIADQNSAVVAGASVNIKNTDTGFERTVTTNSDGFFSAPLLPLGKYKVTASAKGFSNSIFESNLSVGQTLNIKIDLKVGGSS